MRREFGGFWRGVTELEWCECRCGVCGGGGAVIGDAMVMLFRPLFPWQFPFVLYCSDYDQMAGGSFGAEYRCDSMFHIYMNQGEYANCRESWNTRGRDTSTNRSDCRQDKHVLSACKDVLRQSQRAMSSPQEPFTPEQQMSTIRKKGPVAQGKAKSRCFRGFNQSEEGV
jgi:hypothetical protein